MLLFLSKPMLAQESQEEVVTEEELKSMLWDDAQTRYDYLFLQAVCQQLNGKNDLAFDLLKQCLAIHPQAAEAYFLQGQLYAKQRNDSLALQNFEKAASLQPKNTDYQERVAQYYIGTGAYKKQLLLMSKSMKAIMSGRTCSIFWHSYTINRRIMTKCCQS